jgi:hypothetical protein
MATLAEVLVSFYEGRMSQILILTSRRSRIPTRWISEEYLHRIPINRIIMPNNYFNFHLSVGYFGHYLVTYVDKGISFFSSAVTNFYKNSIQRGHPFAKKDQSSDPSAPLCSIFQDFP